LFNLIRSGIGEFQVHHEVAKRAVNVSAVALRRRVVRRVHEVDGDVLGVDDVVGLVQGADRLVSGDDSILTDVGARCV
jgi:hypothetical protein